MGEALAEETGVTCEERGRLEPVQIAQDLLLIPPLRAADFEADMVGSEAPAGSRRAWSRGAGPCLSLSSAPIAGTVQGQSPVTTSRRAVLARTR